MTCNDKYFEIDDCPNDVIEILRGNNKQIIGTVRISNGDPMYLVPLSKFTIRLIVKREINDDDDDAIITLEPTFLEPANGRIRFDFLPAHTNSDEAKANLKDGIQYHYDVTLTITKWGKTEYYTLKRANFIIRSQTR